MVKKILFAKKAGKVKNYLEKIEKFLAQSTIIKTHIRNDDEHLRALFSESQENVALMLYASHRYVCVCVM